MRSLRPGWRWKRSGQRSLAELAGEHQVHPHQITAWKKQLIESLPEVFGRRRVEDAATQEQLVERLYQRIGKLTVELDWLKKNLDWTVEHKRMSIDLDHPRISVARQCQLLGLPRSSWYYRAHRDEAAQRDDERIMQLIDRQYTLTPFYGVLTMRHHLRQMGIVINIKRVRRLMRLMGLEAIYPKPSTSVNCLSNKVFPYLLRNVTIARADHVWSTDITYIPMFRGHAYLVAVMDWFSRYVLSWELSTTMDVMFCISALKQALSLGTPEIFNSDQGSQFTSSSFTRVLLDAGIAISMDGRGRALDNVFIERLWRRVKHEEV